MIKKFSNFTVNENQVQTNLDHIGWVIGTLESWASTYQDEEEYEYDEEQGYEYILELIEKLKNDTCTKEDYNDILFHLWQAIGQEDSYD